MVKGYILSILSALIYATMPLMASFVYADGVNPLTLVVLRNVLALPFLALISIARHESLKISFKDFLKTFVIGTVAFCFTPLLLFSSYNYIASGTATVFHFIYPAVVVVAEIMFFKKKVARATLVSVVLCFIGILLFYNPNEVINLKGAAFALSSGITMAAYVIMLVFMSSKSLKGFVLPFYMVLSGAVSMSVIGLATNSLSFPQSAFGWGMSVAFAFAISCGGVVLFQLGTAIIGGVKASIVSTLDPILCIIIGVVFLHETVSIQGIVGSALVVLASVLIATSDIKKRS